MSTSSHGRSDLVLPGDLLGTAEEFVPGQGTYEDKGRVYAALFGHTQVDPQARAISVHALNAIPRIAEGDLVYARVDEIKSAKDPVEASGTVDGTAVDTVTMTYPAGAACAVTKRTIYLSKSTHLPLRRSAWSGDTLVKQETFSAVKINPGLKQDDFT
jgi:exosome complex RNA-binding protein Csl4